jgi:hypothetical protein
VIVSGVRRRVSLVKQELLTLPEHRSSPPIFCGIRVVFCRSLFVLFRLATVLSVLRSTASDYPFGIFKFLSIEHNKNTTHGVRQSILLEVRKNCHTILYIEEESFIDNKEFNILSTAYKDFIYKILA